MLTRDQDGSISYYENTSEYRLQTEDICDDVKADVMLSDMEYAIVGGKIEIRINLMVCREGYTRNTHKPLLEFRQEQEPYPEERAALRICRVKKGESLWEIAKESHTDMAIVKAENKLTDDVVPQDMMLLVPLR
jgi:LysM repeat protein